MPESPGQAGLSAQFRCISSAPIGQVGFSIELGSNVLIRVVDQAGRPVQRGVVLTLSYLLGAVPVIETVAYDGSRPMNRTLPAGTLLDIAASGAGIASTTAAFQVAISGRSTFIITVQRLQGNRLIRWR